MARSAAARSIVAWVALLAALLSGCENLGLSSLLESVQEAAAEPRYAAPDAATEVIRLTDTERAIAGLAVEEVQLHESRPVLRAMAMVLAPQSQTAIVSHAFSGRVSEILVRVGERVERGQPVLVLESQAVGQAKSDFYKAIADLELAQLNVERERHLLEQGIGVNKNLVAAEATFKIAQSTREVCEKALHVLGFTEDQVLAMGQTHQISPSIQLFAPLTGRVVEINVVVGAPVDESTEILKIADTDVVWVDAEIYEKDFAKVVVGQQTRIRVPAFPDTVFDGSLTYVGDRFDLTTRTITVRSEVQNAEGKLKAGMFADVEILLNGTTQMLAVHKDAVLQDGDKRIVFVVAGDGYRRREIETGPLAGEYLTVVRGLEKGEQVVVEGNYQLRSVLLRDQLQAEHSH